MGSSILSFNRSPIQAKSPEQVSFNRSDAGDTGYTVCSGCESLSFAGIKTKKALFLLLVNPTDLPFDYLLCAWLMTLRMEDSPEPLPAIRAFPHLITPLYSAYFNSLSLISSSVLLKSVKSSDTSLTAIIKSVGTVK